MGNRDALLEGAKRCLVSRGWARTTVRDIAREAGVSHAAIGYHFGSRENLLVTALFEAIEDLGLQIEQSLRGDDDPADLWQALLDSFDTHRPLWLAQLEAITQAQHVPALRQRLVDGQTHSREAFGGTVPLALLLGLMVQSLIEPTSAHELSQVAEELASLAEALGAHAD